MIAFTSAAAARSAATIRAAADLVEQGIGGLSVCCQHDRIMIQVVERDGDPAARARRVAAVAGVLGCVPAQHDSHASAYAWLEAAGQISGVPAEIFTPLAVRSAPGRAGSLAAGPGGRVAVIGGGYELPPGWRWVTELDDPHAAAAAVAEQVA